MPLDAPSRATRGIALVALLFVALVIAACSPTASPSSSANATTTPTASSTAAATASPTASVAPSAAASAALADPAVGLKIGAPYTLAPLDPALETSFRQQFAGAVGAFGSLIAVGGREIDSNGALAGYVMIMGFPAGFVTDSIYQAMLGGMTSSSQVTFTKTTVSGTEVSSGTMATAALGIYRAGDKIVMTFAPTATVLTPITTALVTAN
jgi:hypothetical protein